MSAVAEAMNELLHFPETLEKMMTMASPASSQRPLDHQSSSHRLGTTSFAVDILETPKEYVFHVDVPGLSKSDIQVTVEEDNHLVIKSNGKRKREEDEEHGCKYIRLERRPPQKLVRKFKLPPDCDTSAITAKCESGVLTVVVEKLPPPPKPKTVEVSIS